MSPDITRREFLGATACAAAAAAAVRTAGAQTAAAERPVREAAFWEPLGEGAVQCTLCPWQCTVADGKRGRCRVRENRKGKYYTLVHSLPCTVSHGDPIEKKPFFHVYPGCRTTSVATVGCNFTCKFCQNYEISQVSPGDVPEMRVTPELLAAAAAARRNKVVAYTYSEPTVFYEYMVDCCKAAKEAGVGNVVVSNGFIAQEPLKKLLPLLTAMKVDFKAFSQDFYADVCGGRLKPVQETLKTLAGSGVWFEIVVLTIPTLNDNMDDVKRMAEWIVKELGPNVPVHFTRFHPQYRLTNLPITPVGTLEQACATATAQGCNFVYGGNVPGFKGENTYCPKCKALIVDRHGNSLLLNDLKSGKCAKCSTVIPGIWG